MTTTQTPQGAAYVAFYHDWRGKTPANAVRLAIADIEAIGGTSSSDYMHALRVAARLLDELPAALQGIADRIDAGSGTAHWTADEHAAIQALLDKGQS